jgi:hypothetical protein
MLFLLDEQVPFKRFFVVKNPYKWVHQKYNPQESDLCMKHLQVLVWVLLLDVILVY